MRIAPVTPEMTKMTINKNDIFTFLNHVFCMHPPFSCSHENGAPECHELLNVVNPSPFFLTNVFFYSLTLRSFADVKPMHAISPREHHTFIQKTKKTMAINSIIHPTKKLREIRPGEKVKGYAVLNEFGEFEFTPMQEGVREGQQKHLCSGDMYTLSYSRHHVFVRLKIPRRKRMAELMADLVRTMNEVFCRLQTYDIGGDFTA